jgi:ketosteroid isomerase-like protein
VSARAAARRYVDAVNARDLDALMALFAADAVVVHPSGRYEGRGAIAAFYRDLVFAGQAALTAGRLLADADDVVAMLELVGSSPLDGHQHRLHALDAFDVDPDSGLITALVVYAR